CGSSCPAAVVRLVDFAGAFWAGAFLVVVAFVAGAFWAVVAFLAAGLVAAPLVAFGLAVRVPGAGMGSAFSFPLAMRSFSAARVLERVIAILRSRRIVRTTRESTTLSPS